MAAIRGDHRWSQCEIIYLMLTSVVSLICVSCHEFVLRNDQNSFNRPILRPDSDQTHEQPYQQSVQQLNERLSERAHPRPKTIGLEDRAERPPESRPIPQEANHVRQQMPYQSIDRHLRSPNGRQQQQLVRQQQHKTSHKMSEEGDRRTQRKKESKSPLKKTKPVHEMPFLLTNNFIDNSLAYEYRNRKQPEIYEDGRHLRIQSPLERGEEFNDNLQAIDRSNDWRPIPVKQRDRNPKTYSYNSNDVNSNPLRHLSQSHRQKNIGLNDKRHHLYRRPNPEDLVMKMVLPKNKNRNKNKNKSREETRVNGFESFTSNHKHEESDKIYPTGERDRHNSRLLNDVPQEEPEVHSYRSAPEKEIRYQTHLNHFPPFVNDEDLGGATKKPSEDYRRASPEKSNHYVEENHSNLDHIPNYFRNHFQQNKQQSQHKHIQSDHRTEANRRDRHNNPSHQFRPIDLNIRTFRTNIPNNIELQRDYPSYEKNNFYANDYERKRTSKPENHVKDTAYGRPVKKEIEIVREITEILPVNDDTSDDFEPPIATPAPPDLPIMPSYGLKEEIDAKLENDERDSEESPEKDRSDIDNGKSVNSAKEDNFYDDYDEAKSQPTDYDRPKDMFGKVSTLENEDKDEKRKKSKFEKEVDVSADELENYFDKEFANEAEKDEEGQRRLEFDDEPKESKQISKKSVDSEDADVEAEYKSATDFLQNHDDFLNKIEKENEKFRKRTEDKVEKEEDDEAEAETEKKVDDGEKELDETDKKEGEEIEDKTQTDQKANKEDNKSNEEEESSDSNEGSTDKANQTEGEEEREAKEGTEKSADNDDNQSGEKNEEQGDDSETKDEEKSDNTESDETNESNDENATKSDKCMESNESNCDKELLKEESKESKNTEELKSKQAKEELGGEGVDRGVVQANEDKSNVKEEKSSSVASIETKPIESNANRNAKISERHNFAPLFIDLKRINPNKSNIRKGLGNNESLTSRTTSATHDNSPQTKTKHRTQSVSLAPQSTAATDANAGKGSDNAVENRRVVNSINDIIRSQNLR